MGRVKEWLMSTGQLDGPSEAELADADYYELECMEDPFENDWRPHPDDDAGWEVMAQPERPYSPEEEQEMAIIRT